MMIKRIIILSFLLLTSALSAHATDQVYVVKYVSIENVYLAGGLADGLADGDHLSVSGPGNCTAELEVVFTADHSASCKLLTPECTVAIGSKATLTSSRKSDSTAVPADTVVKPAPVTVTTPKAAPDTGKTKYVKKPLAKTSGSVSMLVYWWNDRGPANLDFSQTTARLNFVARHLLDQNITLSVRTRGRYDVRQRSYNSQVRNRAWENKLWEFSLSYDEPESRMSVSAGRILPKRIGSIGYLDGLLIEERMSDQVRIGLLAGSEPQWWYDDIRTSINRGGGYLTYMSGEPGKTNTEQTIAAVGEYHGAVTSREMIALQGRVNVGNHAGFYHTAEIDLYRSWRKAMVGKSMQLSSLYAGGWYRLGTGARLSLSYDNRTNIRTYENRSVADSLFDDHLRHGVRGTVDVSLPLHIQTQLGYGIHKRAGDPATSKTYSGGLTKVGVARRTTMVMFQITAFNSPLEHGLNYSARLSDNLSSKIWAAASHGRYSYTADISGDRRTSSYVELWTQADLSRRYWLSTSAQYNKGDDIDGLRLQFELGYRF